MPDDHLRFRCYRCNQLLGASARRAGSVITCPKCSAELKVPLPGEQVATANASRPGRQASTETPSQARAAAASARPGAGTLPAFMDEIAAAIPEDLASLRPEDIRVEAEFADLVVTTDERIAPAASSAEESSRERLPGDPPGLDIYLSQASALAGAPPEAVTESPSMYKAQAVPIIPTPAEPVVNAQPPPVVPVHSAPVVSPRRARKTRRSMRRSGPSCPPSRSRRPRSRLRPASFSPSAR